MILNDFGKIATDEWFRSFEIRDELILDEFILMPNHLHAIVGLDAVGTVGTRDHTSQPFERKPKSISSFVAGYKSVVLNKIDDLIDERQLPIQKFNRKNPLWQANYL
jgi:REP element-mobilizing transposase RayT